MRKIIVLPLVTLAMILLISSLVLAGLPPPPPTPGGFGGSSDDSSGDESSGSTLTVTSRTDSQSAGSRTASQTATGSGEQKSITSLAQRSSSLEARMLELEEKVDGSGGDWPTSILFLIALNIVLLGLVVYLMRKLMASGNL